ncbi:TPA: hypothetical protein PXM28_000295 [Yersinia enterocolitica]|nr:hypothetical protein [Yersinia enterocolitica]
MDQVLVEIISVIGFGYLGFANQEQIGLLFRLISAQYSPYLRCLNRAGGQAGPPAPAACAKYYCYSQSPPAAVGLIEPARWASLPKRAFRGRPCPLTRAIVFVGNIPDCAQGQKRKSKPLF